MSARFTDEAKFEIDLLLPVECWGLSEDALDDQAGALLRLTYVKGYTDATRDAKSGKIGGLLVRIARLCAASHA